VTASGCRHSDLGDKIAARTKEYENRFLSPFIAVERVE
jgi:hypothetical protein